MTEDIIIKYLIKDENYFSNVFNYLIKDDFRDLNSKKIFLNIGEIYKKYNKVPTINELELYIDTKNLGINEKVSINSKIEDIKNISDDINKEILIDTTEKYIKTNRFYDNVILAGASILDGSSKLTQEEIQKRAEEINKLSFKQTSGLDYINDAIQNFTDYTRLEEDGIQSSLNIVNIATGGGYKPGNLFIFASVSNGGKCQKGNTKINIYVNKELKEKIKEFLDAKRNKS